jgi:DNA polymerase-3 subunit beta
MKLDILKTHMQATVIHAATKDIRFYLCGVLLHTGAHGARIVATDGHTMACAIVGVKPMPELQVIMPAALFTKIKANKKTAPELTVEISDNGSGGHNVEVSVDGTRSIMPAIDGRFPDYMRVLPRKLSGELAQFSPLLIKRGAESAQILGARPEFSGEILHNGGSAAIMCGAFEDFVAVIMPIRSSAKATDWSPPAALLYTGEPQAETVAA